MEQNWQRIDGRCVSDGAEGFPTFGVRVTGPDGTVWEWPDVDPDPVLVDRLVTVLQTAQPEECHWSDLVLDFIHRVATPGE